MALAPYEQVLHLLVDARYFLEDKRIVRHVRCSRINAYADHPSGQGSSVKVAVHLAHYLRLDPFFLKPFIYSFNKGPPARYYEILSLKFCDVYLVPAFYCQWMCLVYQGRYPLLPHMEAVEKGMVARRSNDGQAYKAGTHLFEQVVGASVKYPEAYIRIFADKPREPLRGNIRSHTFNKTYGYGPSHSLAHRMNFGTRFFGKAKYLLGSSVKQLPGFRQLEPPLSSDKKDCIQFLFQTFDLCAERRLAHVQLFGSPCNIQFFSYYNKVAQISQIHISVPKSITPARGTA